MKALLACILVVACVGCATEPMRECERSLRPINAPSASNSDSQETPVVNPAESEGE